ncbi:hypothetical protein K435DRAFT_880244 [Dendrothele bispora CBS 962.96]|uniref:Uncharacterized protein n=1 Tax=Dendrothele bispora (strain CBS 962.96) TaxID=1314807 RepID=A0A4S8KK38_DENBC|nr:hypothetical protein K435DRAFT_880244 [Dendrothele bispora CBS 962.96]
MTSSSYYCPSTQSRPASHSVAALLNPEVGDRFFVGSTLLTRVGPNSKKGKRKGKGEKDEERPKAQPRPECPVGIQSDLDRYQSQFSR